MGVIIKLSPIQYSELHNRLVGSLPDSRYSVNEYYILSNKNLVLDTKAQCICVINELSNIILCMDDLASDSFGSDKSSLKYSIKTLHALQSKVETYLKEWEGN